MLFVQFRNKNIKGIKRNFKVGFFLFLSGNTRNVGFSLSTFFFFFFEKKYFYHRSVILEQFSIGSF